MRSRSIAAALSQAVMQEFLTTGMLDGIMRAIAVRQPQMQDRAKPVAAQAVRWLTIAAAALVFALTGAGLLLAAIYVPLAELWGAATALSVMGATLWLAVLALLLYERRPRPNSPTPAAAGSTADHLMESAAAISLPLKKIAAAHPFLVVAAAFGIGMILAQPANESAFAEQEPDRP